MPDELPVRKTRNPIRRIAEWLDDRRLLRDTIKEQAKVIDGLTALVREISEDRNNESRRADEFAARAATLETRFEQCNIDRQTLCSERYKASSERTAAKAELSHLKARFVATENRLIDAGANLVRADAKLESLASDRDSHRTVAEEATAALTVIHAVLTKYGFPFDDEAEAHET